MRMNANLYVAAGCLAAILATPACSFGDNDDLCSNTCLTAFDNECDDGGPGSLFSICALGTDCDDCGARRTNDNRNDGSCTNTCAFAFDGECDDGGIGALTSLCTFGTDCADCGTR